MTKHDPLILNYLLKELQWEFPDRLMGEGAWILKDTLVIDIKKIRLYLGFKEELQKFSKRMSRKYNRRFGVLYHDGKFIIAKK